MEYRLKLLKVSDFSLLPGVFTPIFKMISTFFGNKYYVLQKKFDFGFQNNFFTYPPLPTYWINAYKNDEIIVLNEEEKCEVIKDISYLNKILEKRKEEFIIELPEVKIKNDLQCD